MKSPHLFGAVALIASVCSFMPQSVSADDLQGVPATQSILIISTSCSKTKFDVDLKDAFNKALSSISPAPKIDNVIIPAHGYGIYTELVKQTKQTNLSNWCQVYDLRFRDDSNNVAWKGQASEDVFTMVGANNDYDLFTSYLNSGGSLFMQGEHSDFFIRNTNLINFVNSVAAIQIKGSVSIHVDNVNITAFSATPEKFSTDFNSLGSAGPLKGYFVGGIPLANIGSARPITTLDIGAMAICYLPADLKTNAGRMVVSFEANAFCGDRTNTTSNAWIQNVYDLLSTGCFRYDLDKTFIPAEGRKGSTGTFEITYKNTGTTDIVGLDVRDSIPKCLDFISSVPAPVSNSGNVYHWNVGTIKPGTTGKVVVTFKSTQLPPCPQ